MALMVDSVRDYYYHLQNRGMGEDEAWKRVLNIQRSSPFFKNHFYRCKNCKSIFHKRDGHYIDDPDVGKEPLGGIGELSKEEAEQRGKEWEGFKEDHIGFWCRHCFRELESILRV